MTRDKKKQQAAPPPERTPFDVLEAEFLSAATELGQMPAPALTEVAVAGRSNVGKSSLLNMLLMRRNLVRTSSTPGCTRSINLFSVKTRGGLHLQLADLPGYGFAQRSRSERREWGALIEGYLRTRPTLRLMLVLVDVRRGLEQDELDLLDFGSAARPGCPPLALLVVATKLDLLPKNQRKPALAALASKARCSVVGCSAEDHTGRHELWKAITRLLGLAAPLNEGSDAHEPSEPNEPKKPQVETAP